jgi:hypothetical protein
MPIAPVATGSCKKAARAQKGFVDDDVEAVCREIRLKEPVAPRVLRLSQKIWSLRIQAGTFLASFLIANGKQRLIAVHLA